MLLNWISRCANNKSTFVLFEGPNTPPEPPSSPTSSPDAYDPFEPTKSRSASPEQSQTAQSQQQNATTQPSENIESESSIADGIVPGADATQQNGTVHTSSETRTSPMNRVISVLTTKRLSPDRSPTSTPNTNTGLTEQDPPARTSPSDKQTTANGNVTVNNGMEVSHIGVVINRQVQSAPAPAIVKPMVSSQPAIFSSTGTLLASSSSSVQTGVATRQNAFGATSGKIKI